MKLAGPLLLYQPGPYEPTHRRDRHQFLQQLYPALTRVWKCSERSNEAPRAKSRHRHPAEWQRRIPTSRTGTTSPGHRKADGWAMESTAARPAMEAHSMDLCRARCLGLRHSRQWWADFVLVSCKRAGNVDGLDVSFCAGKRHQPIQRQALHAAIQGYPQEAQRSACLSADG